MLVIMLEGKLIGKMIVWYCNCKDSFGVNQEECFLCSIVTGRFGLLVFFCLLFYYSSQCCAKLSYPGVPVGTILLRCATPRGGGLLHSSGSSRL